MFYENDFLCFNITLKHFNITFLRLQKILQVFHIVGVQLGCGLMAMTAIAYESHHFHSL